MSGLKVQRVEKGSVVERQLISYAHDCSWVVGGHPAMLLREDKMNDWECAFALLDENGIWGFCTLLKTDYYPETRYSPWISTLFVDERKRGAALSGKLIEAAIEYARQNGFTRVYIPTDMTGFYEKYGFERIDELMNYGGDVDHIYVKEI